LHISEWKWEVVTIYFITKFPKIERQHDSIMLVVENLTKAAHFNPVKMIHKATNIVEIYMKKIARIHGVPKAIVSNRDFEFTSHF
jgi:hypothetical protein